MHKPHNLFNINCHEKSFGTDFKWCSHGQNIWRKMTLNKERLKVKNDIFSVSLNILYLWFIGTNCPYFYHYFGYYILRPFSVIYSLFLEGMCILSPTKMWWLLSHVNSISTVNETNRELIFVVLLITGKAWLKAFIGDCTLYEFRFQSSIKYERLSAAYTPNKTQ